ncbi:GtrA family protein [Enterococcus mediterraneensis]|uniref:GtrA family protein n=1 Tax=Enterococcus mediterraneensis TaxID=2364791 RepID=UPI000F0687DC|nr:GtrA family protein [Enterococcus mediterraneensis]
MRLFFWFKEQLTKRGLWEIFMYLFYGGLTTLVNFVVYFVFKDVFHMYYLYANIFSWIASVLFAFVTNKLWVFHSKTETISELIIEFAKFVFYRLVSFVMDMGSMYLLIGILHSGDFLAKLITQILVVVANYVFSKLFIFKKKVIVEKTDE